MSEETPISTLKSSLNKQKIRLIFPYSMNKEVKTLGAKWDITEKYWYYPSLDGTLPEELKQYKSFDVAIEYSEKEYYKPLLKSLKWDKLRNVWIVNTEDYKRFLSYS